MWHDTELAHYTHIVIPVVQYIFRYCTWLYLLIRHVLIALHGGSGEQWIMSEIYLQPPDPFNFKVPDEWRQWWHHFEQFCVTSGLQDASASKQVNMLLYCLGEEAKSMLKSIKITEEETKNYETVLEKYNNLFQVRRNVILRKHVSIANVSSQESQWNSKLLSYTTWWNIVITGTWSETAS